MLKAQQVGLESVLESGSGAIEKIDDLARRLTENERSLAECPAIGNTLDYVMKRVRSVLIHAADHLAVEQVSLWLDPMNVRLPAGGAAAATGIRLPEVVVRHEPRIHVLVGRFPRRELIRRESLFDEARRLLLSGCGRIERVLACADPRSTGRGRATVIGRYAPTARAATRMNKDFQAMCRQKRHSMRLSGEASRTGPIHAVFSRGPERLRKKCPGCSGLVRSTASPCQTRILMRNACRTARA